MRAVSNTSRTLLALGWVALVYAVYYFHFLSDLASSASAVKALLVRLHLAG